MHVNHLTNWTFQVSSESDPQRVYEIDLSGDPSELCQCGDFWNKHSPHIKRGEHPSKHRCKHILAIAEWLFWNEIYPKAQLTNKKI